MSAVYMAVVVYYGKSHPGEYRHHLAGLGRFWYLLDYKRGVFSFTPSQDEMAFHFQEFPITADGIGFIDLGIEEEPRVHGYELRCYSVERIDSGLGCYCPI